MERAFIIFRFNTEIEDFDPVGVVFGEALAEQIKDAGRLRIKPGEIAAVMAADGFDVDDDMRTRLNARGLLQFTGK